MCLSMGHDNSHPGTPSVPGSTLWESLPRSNADGKNPLGRIRPVSCYPETSVNLQKSKGEMMGRTLLTWRERDLGFEHGSWHFQSRSSAKLLQPLWVSFLIFNIYLSGLEWLTDLEGNNAGTVLPKPKAPHHTRHHYYWDSTRWLRECDLTPWTLHWPQPAGPSWNQGQWCSTDPDESSEHLVTEDNRVV